MLFPTFCIEQITGGNEYPFRIFIEIYQWPRDGVKLQGYKILAKLIFEEEFHCL